MTVTTQTLPKANSPSLSDEAAHAQKRSTAVESAPTVHAPSDTSDRAASTAQNNQPKRVTRTNYLSAASLTPAQRTALIDDFFDIYRETVHGFDRTEFESQLFGAGEVRLALFYGADDELAGFATLQTENITHDNSTHAVYCGSTYFRLGYNGGPSSMLFGLREALRFKLRHPRTPLAYLTRNASPAVYRLIDSIMPTKYPSPACEAPAHIEALVRIVGQRRGYIPVAKSPWVVNSVATPHDPSRLQRLENDPSVQFYLRTNPQFAQGNSLLVWTPLNIPNIAGGFSRALRRRLRR